MNQEELELFEEDILERLANFIVLHLADELERHHNPATAALRTGIALDDILCRAKRRAEQKVRDLVSEVPNVTRD